MMGCGDYSYTFNFEVNSSCSDYDDNDDEAAGAAKNSQVLDNIFNDMDIHLKEGFLVDNNTVQNEDINMDCAATVTYQPWD